MEKGCSWLGVLVLAVCFGSWHAWSVIKVGRGKANVEEINKVPEKDLDKVCDNLTAKAEPKVTNDLSTDAEYEDLYSDDSSDGHELTEVEIDAIFNKTDEKRKIHEEILKEEEEKEERLQKAMRNEDEESLESIVENAHIPKNVSMREFAEDLENITKAEHGPADSIHLNRKMMDLIPKDMTLRDFEDYVQKEEKEMDEELEEEEEEAKELDPEGEMDDDLLYEEPVVTDRPRDQTRHEYIILDVYENFTQEESGKIDFEQEDFLHDKSLNETAFLKEKGLLGHEQEWNETFID